MTNRDLEIFMEVAECGRMSDVAKKLIITQSSVSQSIAAIEKEYGILLFERLSHRLYLTKAGQDLLNYARSLFAIKGDMEEFLRSKSSTGNIRIGATLTVGTCVISPILLRLEKLLPSVCSEVHVANTSVLEEMLLKNEIDIGLVEGKIIHPDLTTINAIADRLVLICSPQHRFADRENVDIYELENEPLILREQGSGTRAQFEKQLEAHKINYTVRWSCGSPEGIKRAVQDGHGISVISERLVREELKNSKLCACEINDINLDRSFDLVYHKNKFFTDALNCFVQCCKEFNATNS